METMTRGLVKYEEPRDSRGGDDRPGAGRGEGWQAQADMAAACLAAAALQAGMPRVVGGERQLALFLADRVAQRRRTEALKFLVVTLCEIVGVAAGLYIGAMQ